MPDFQPAHSSACYCAALRQAARTVTGFYDSAVARGGLRITQYATLRNLDRLGPSTLQDLGEVLKLERTTLLRNLNILRKQGLIAEAPGLQKARRVKLTAKGEAKLKCLVPLWEKAQERVDALLTPEEKAFLGRILEKLQNLKA